MREMYVYVQSEPRKSSYRVNISLVLDKNAYDTVGLELGSAIETGKQSRTTEQAFA